MIEIISMNFYKKLFKDCAENHIMPWQCPGFLFVMMGFVNISLMIGVYIIIKDYDVPELVVFSVSIVSIISFIVGSSIINGFQQIARSNKMKLEFVSIASHQLKTPLSGMRWATDILIMDKKNRLSDSQLGYVKDIKESTSRMIRLVNDLLDVSKIESGRMNFVFQEVNLPNILTVVIKEFSSFASSHNTKIVLDIDDNIPLARTDSIRIKMVMQNFIDNAIKYICLENGLIEVSLKNKGDKIIFSVKDNGLGIPRKDQQKVFEKFFRSDNISRNKIAGTGLGLYIARAAIKSSNGDIGFESKEGEGSNFWFKLPVFKM